MIQEKKFILIFNVNVILSEPQIKGFDYPIILKPFI